MMLEGHLMIIEVNLSYRCCLLQHLQASLFRLFLKTELALAIADVLGIGTFAIQSSHKNSAQASRTPCGILPHELLVRRTSAKVPSVE